MASLEMAEAFVKHVAKSQLQKWSHFLAKWVVLISTSVEKAIFTLVVKPL
jgi:hypothetical protein